MAKREWTDEQRRKLSARIKETRPWEKSTGPKTEDGKQRAAFNSYKHGNRSQCAHEVRDALKFQDMLITQIEDMLKLSKYLK